MMINTSWETKISVRNAYSTTCEENSQFALPEKYLGLSAYKYASIDNDAWR